MSGGGEVKRVLAVALFAVSGATGFMVFLPLIRNDGAMWFHEYNPVIRWGEFLTCMAFMALGFIGLKGEK